MPGQISHILAAEEALFRSAPELAARWQIRAGWNPSPAGLPKGPSEWFRFGAQGPDIFYHNQRTKPSGLHYGVLAHRRNYGLAVEAMTGDLIASGKGLDSPEVAWLLGFATHAAVDRAIHPFIVHFAGWQSPLLPDTWRYRSCHPFFERLLDMHILARLRSLSVGSCDLEFLLPLGPANDGGSRDTDPAEASIRELLETGLRSAFPRAVAADFLIKLRIENAIADARYFLRATNPARTSTESDTLLAYFDDRSGWRSMALVYPESLPEGLDIGNEGRLRWEHPAGDGRHSKRSHVELFEEATSDAAGALSLVLEAFARREIGADFARKIGNGGLSVTDKNGMPLPPRLSRPLPLMEIMEAELARRLEAAKQLAERDRRM